MKRLKISLLAITTLSLWFTFISPTNAQLSEKFNSRYIEANPIKFFINKSVFEKESLPFYIRDSAQIWTTRAKIPKWVETSNKEEANVIFTTVNSSNINYTGFADFEDESPGGKSKITIRLNLFRLGNQENTMKTIVHEMGHALGLAHNDTDPNSVMISNRQYLKSYIPDDNDVKYVRERYRGL